MTQKTPEKRPWVNIIAIVAVFGLFMFIRGQIILTDTGDYLTSDGWATTTGTRIRDNNKTAFIEFEYTVDGERYVGTRTRFYQAVLFSGDSEVTKFAEQYPIGSEFTIYYDPADPQRSVINPAFPVWRAALQVCLLTVIIPVLVIVSVVLRRIRRVFRIGP